MTPTFFTDYNLGKRFPARLAEAGIDVEPHIQHFRQDCPDEDWLAEIGRRGWVALTHDRRIRYKPNELAAVMQHRVALLVVIGDAPFPELADAFVATLPRVLSFIEGQRPPYIAKVYRPSATEAAANNKAPGRVELWHPRDSRDGR